MNKNTFDLRCPGDNPDENLEIPVGRRLRALRTQRGLSLRALAGLSGLNGNTLALVENGKSSPSVSTLQRLARTLEVPLGAFFETSSIEKSMAFTPAGQVPTAKTGHTMIENLGKNLAGGIVQPFVVALPPGMDSGDGMIGHTGYDFVFGLSGTFRYQVEDREYLLNPATALSLNLTFPIVGKPTAQIQSASCPH